MFLHQDHGPLEITAEQGRDLNYYVKLRYSKTVQRRYDNVNGEGSFLKLPCGIRTALTSAQIQGVLGPIFFGKAQNDDVSVERKSVWGNGIAASDPSHGGLPTCPRRR